MAQLVDAQLNLNEEKTNRSKTAKVTPPSNATSTVATTKKKQTSATATTANSNQKSAAVAAKTTAAATSQEPSIVKQIKKSVSRLDTTSDLGLENLVNVLHHFAFGIEQQQQQVEIKKTKNQKQLIVDATNKPSLASSQAAAANKSSKQKSLSEAAAPLCGAKDEELAIGNEFEHGIVVEEFCNCACGASLEAHEKLEQTQQGTFICSFIFR